MDIKNMLKIKISKYFSNKISKDDLYNWSVEILHKVLKGSVLELKNLEVWEMLTQIPSINDMDYEQCNNLLLRFHKILYGEECSSYTFFIQIPEKFALRNLSRLKGILLKYIQDKKLLKSDILEMQCILSKVPSKPDSLFDMLEIRILELLKLGYDFYPEEENICYDLKNSLYVSEINLLEHEFLKKIIKLIQCYEGQQSFFINIFFKNGEGTISIQI